MAKYTKLRGGLLRRDDNASIPADPANADYREFLVWQAAGNSAEDEPAPAPQPITAVPAWAAKAALDEAGLLTAVGNLVLSAGLLWKWRFTDATEWRRDAVLQLAPQMNPPLTTEQVDALLARAAAIASS
jgi:hypothetical protein